MKQETPASGCALDRGDVRGSGELETGAFYDAEPTIRGAVLDLRAVLSDLRGEWPLRSVKITEALKPLSHVILSAPRQTGRFLLG